MHYLFDSVSGNSVGNIAKGSAVYDATLENGAIVSNNQLQLSAAQSQYMSINPFTTGTTGLTFATWWKSDNSGSWARIFDFGNGPGADNIFISNFPDTGMLVLDVTESKMYTSIRFNQNAWNHIAWTLDPSGTWLLYINGVLGNYATPMPYPNSILRSNNYLGRSNWAVYGDAYLNGFIEDFRLYSRVLSEPEVQALFNATHAIPISGAINCTNCSAVFPASCMILPLTAVNTGVGGGTFDPYWKVISVPFDFSYYYSNLFIAGSNAYIMTANDGWSSPSSWPSKWIGVTSDVDLNIPSGDYIFQLSFASASYYSTSVEVYFLVDDALTSVAVSDGSTTIQTSTSFSSTYSANGYTCFSSFTLSTFGPTITILSFTVSNIGYSASGLLVQFGEFEYIDNCPTPTPTCKPLIEMMIIFVHFSIFLKYYIYSFYCFFFSGPYFWITFLLSFISTARYPN